MTTAAINGIDINYNVHGKGPAVLLTHGYSATGQMWDGQRPALETKYRLITWDMRGHGHTAAPDEPDRYSEALTVEDMKALLLHLGEKRAVVGGLSLGGYMSLAFYGKHPEMVRALVICDSGPGYRNPDARATWNARAEKWARDFEERGLEVLRERSTEMKRAMADHQSVQGLANAARGMLAQRDSSVMELLPKIKVPTLIIVGDKDEPFIAPCNYMASKIPGARLDVIAGAGHAANIDQPEAFNKVLGEFLSTLP